MVRETIAQAFAGPATMKTRVGIERDRAGYAAGCKRIVLHPID
jgi:hypothetical protein